MAKDNDKEESKKCENEGKTEDEKYRLELHTEHLPPPRGRLSDTLTNVPKGEAGISCL